MSVISICTNQSYKQTQFCVGTYPWILILHMFKKLSFCPGDSLEKSHTELFVYDFLHESFMYDFFLYKSQHQVCSSVSCFVLHRFKILDGLTLMVKLICALDLI